jgi:hypothetical protein
LAVAGTVTAVYFLRQAERPFGDLAALGIPENKRMSVPFGCP